ncbi:hypothetical protein GCM10007857_51750 [Bradyrhizobium iriomotense]|uniref:Uncharacterized protein n=2 Tax=Bradyrhizobium iriomotense TaxID=441950 RepID=A0ABQ6B8E8_9BRAD|nr:hypothetical protein GCM10007857_51750 [Bradyrhizobium iriomotense]
MNQAENHCARCGRKLIHTPDINLQGVVVTGRQWCENHRCPNGMQVPISPLLYHWLSWGDLPEDKKLIEQGSIAWKPSPP